MFRKRHNAADLSRQASAPRRRGFQIGPKIRVGGTLGKIGQAAKIGVGKLDKMAAPFVAAIPGIGQIAAPIMNIAGNAMDTTGGGLHMNNIGKVGLQSALMAGGGHLLSSIPGVSSLGNALGNIPGVSQVAGALGGAKNAVQGIPGVQGVEQFLGQHGGAGGLLHSAGDFLGGNGGMNLLGTAEGVNAAMLQSKQNDLAKNALGTAQQSYGERQPLRAAGIQNMLNPSAGIAPKVAALSANSSNPYMQKGPNG